MWYCVRPCTWDINNIYAQNAMNKLDAIRIPLEVQHWRESTRYLNRYNLKMMNISIKLWLPSNWNLLNCCWQWHVKCMHICKACVDGRAPASRMILFVCFQFPKNFKMIALQYVFTSNPFLMNSNFSGFIICPLKIPHKYHNNIYGSLISNLSIIYLK